MAFNYQNDIDSKMENYPSIVALYYTYITAGELRVHILLTSEIDARVQCHAHPQPNTNQLAI